MPVRAERPLSLGAWENDLVSTATAAAIGALAFYLCVGFQVVNPRAVDWLFIGGPDPSVNFIGWHMLRASPWALPWGAVPALGYPVGTSVALTDSIPVVAIALKALRGFLPETFQYFGLWLLLCFILQGVFAALLVGTVTRSRPLRILGAALFVLSPAIAHRLGHMALCAHWLLLAALWLNRRQGAADAITWRRFAAWCLLIGITAGTHPYLTIMVLALAGATILAWFRTWPQAVVGTAAAVGVLVGIAAAVWWAGGYFIVPNTTSLRSPGFGRLSMNALAPLIPPPGALTYGRIDWSTAYYEQHEGFSYLGLGAALIVALSLLLLRPRVPTSRSNLSLALVCLLLTLFALSPVVTIGTRTLVEYPPEWWGPLSTFRASGRMFWPVLYVWIHASIAVVVRRLPVAAASVILAAAVALQLADLDGVFRLKRTLYAMQMSDPLPSEFWDVVPRHYKHIVLQPTNMCAPTGQGLDYRFFALHAGYAGATINGGFAARYDLDGVQRYCQQLARDTQEGNVSDDTLYVVGPGLESLFRGATRPVSCVRVDGHGACFTARSQEAWAEDFRVNERWLPPLAEFRLFREALEAEYRERLERPRVEMRGTPRERMDAMIRYLGYRLGGCDMAEASGYVLSEVSGEPGGRLCQEQAGSPKPMPPPSEIDELYAVLSRTAAGTSGTHVDPEGERVWAYTYAQHRLRGDSHETATTAVLTAIRNITQR